MANHSQQQVENSSNSTRTYSSECIAWLTVFGIEAVAIVTLNALTIIVYLKERSLRKRSMFLVINLAVADMFTGPSILIFFSIYAYQLELWAINPPLSDELIFLILVLAIVSPTASLINLGAISLERTHATFQASHATSLQASSLQKENLRSRCCYCLNYSWGSFNWQCLRKSLSTFTS